MLNEVDLKNLLALIQSPKLSVSGSEVMTVAVLQQKLGEEIANCNHTPPTTVTKPPEGPA